MWLYSFFPTKELQSMTALCPGRIVTGWETRNVNVAMVGECSSIFATVNGVDEMLVEFSFASSAKYRTGGE
jgi:hypothetical protein